MTRKRKKNSSSPQRWGDWVLYQIDPETSLRPVGPDDLIWKNGVFAVQTEVVWTTQAWSGPSVPILHLDFRREDRKAIRDWRMVQRMKSELCGADCEAVELFPHEERLLDGANQYHLWVLPPGMEFPFGYPQRSVMDNAGAVATLRQIGYDGPLTSRQRDWGLEGMDVGRYEKGTIRLAGLHTEWSEWSPDA